MLPITVILCGAYVYYSGKPTGLAAEFLDYMLSDDVQKGVVTSMGYISINDMSQQGR